MSPLSPSHVAPLADQLTAEFGDRLPSGVIDTTVTAAWHAVPTHDVQAVRELARADVAGLADAVSRRSTTASS